MQRVTTLVLSIALFALLASQAQAGKQARAIPWTGDWMQAVQRVQAAYPGSAGWLIACSASEGGHGLWQWRNPNGYLRYTAAGAPIYVADIPGGPLQYFQGTFWADYRAAVADLRSRGFKPPPSSASWYSMLGQAIAGGWAWGHNRPAGKWTGGSC